MEDLQKKNAIDHMKIYNDKIGTASIYYDNDYEPSFYYCIYPYKEFSENKNYI